MITTVAKDLNALTRTALIELIEINASSPSIGGGVLRFTNFQSSTGQPISWKGQQYTTYAMELSDIEYVGKGVSNRPTLRVANLTGVFTALCAQYKDLLGAKVTRRRVLDKYLDGRPNANTSAGLPEEMWYIERKTIETNDEVAFELASPMDLDNVMIPFMRVNATHCQVREYRGSECSYTGTNFFKADNTAIYPITSNQGVYNSATSYTTGQYFYVLYGTTRFYYVCIQNAPAGTALSNRAYFQPDLCGRRITSCVARFGATAQLPFLAFPGTTRLPQ